jgi:hypothetical protein
MWEIAVERQNEANSTDEIKVSDEMIMAGIKEYALFDFDDGGEGVVSAIYRAMARVDPHHLK